jgi:hypothetical protein
MGMASKGRRWIHPYLAGKPKINIEESIEMSPKKQREWIVHRKHEPSRLSQSILAQAYSKVVPHYIRILRVPAGEQNLHEARPQAQRRCVR